MHTIDKIIHDELVQYCKDLSVKRLFLPEPDLEKSVNLLMQTLIDAKESGIIKDYEIKDGEVYITHQPTIQEINLERTLK